MPAADMPAAEVDVGPGLVRSLLDEQHPDLASLPLELIANGWDNVIFRLGDELVVRLPRREAAAALIESEQRWLPDLAARLPLPIPSPVRVGAPGAGYPWRWTLARWLDGVVATDAELVDPEADAVVLGGFLAALHRPAPIDAPANPYRGVHLTDRDSSVRAAVDLLEGAVDSDVVLSMWSDACDAAQWGHAPVWVHGDLHPGNVLVRDGRLSAVIDFGDLTSGDPATDLAVAWMLLPPSARAALRSAAGDVDDDTWQRARGWALLFGVVISANSADNPAFAQLGARILAAVSDRSR
jgi:aminoglycoside phosphotransferase (APT) family kinase protein